MTPEAVIGLISAGATITFAVAGAAIWVCAKLEKLHVSITNLVSHEHCTERRRRCRSKNNQNKQELPDEKMPAPEQPIFLCRQR